MSSQFERSPDRQRTRQDLQLSSDRLRLTPNCSCQTYSCQHWLQIAILSLLVCIGLWVGGTDRAIATSLAFISDGSSSNSEVTVNLERGAQIFQNNCAVCHIGGKNLIVPDKNLSLDALHRYGKDSIAAIVKQVTYGKGVMPAFGEGLSTEDITNVATYVLDQSHKGWNTDSTSTLSARKTSKRFND